MFTSENVFVKMHISPDERIPSFIFKQIFNESYVQINGKNNYSSIEMVFGKTQVIANLLFESEGVLRTIFCNYTIP